MLLWSLGIRRVQDEAMCKMVQRSQTSWNEQEEMSGSSNKSNVTPIAGTQARLLRAEARVKSEKVVTAYYCQTSEETGKSSNAHNIIFGYVDVWLLKFATVLCDCFYLQFLTLWIMNSGSISCFMQIGTSSAYVHHKYRLFSTKAIETMEKVYYHYA